MIDILTGANSFLGKRLMQKIGAGAVTVPHDAIPDTAWPDCDRFFFLSTYGNIVGQTDISEIMRANIGHLGYVLESYREESKCEHFTFVSSSSVLLPIQTPYSRAKRAAEEMMLAYGTKGCILRPFSIVGVGEQAEHLIPTLIRSCLEGETMQFVPEPVHDFVDVSDVVEAMLSLAENKSTGIFEIGRGIPVTNAEVRCIVEDICKQKANLRIIDSMRDYDYSNWYMKDNRLALGCTPKKSLKDSIQEMVDAYKFRRKQK